MLRSILFALISSSLLIGCAAALVPYTNDPAKKISQAYWLFDDNQRPLPAEKLILEAIDIYKKNNNQSGLATAHTAYAIFLRSYAVEKYQKNYMKNGFLNKSVSYENRLEKSIEYLELSKNHYLLESEYDNLTNTYLHMGFTYAVAEKEIKACNAFKKSIDANLTFKEKNPETPINLGGFKTFKDYIINVIERGKLSNCEV